MTSSRIADLTSEQLRRMWDANRPTFDEIGSVDTLRKHFAPPQSQSSGIAHAIKALEVWREREPEFFEACPYGWAFHAGSFDFASEAAFQVRALELAISLWKQRHEYAVEIGGFGQILVRQLIQPSSFTSTPMCRKLAWDGAAQLITLPLGWFDLSLHFGLEHARAVAARNDELAAKLAAEVWCRVVADQAIRSFLVDQGASGETRPLWQVTVRRPEIARVIEASVLGSGRAHGDLAPGEVMPHTYGDLAYSAVTFALAHELSHILHDETQMHADEGRADGLAFDMAVRCRAWHGRCESLPVKTPLGLAAVGAMAFIFTMATQIGLDDFIYSDREPFLPVYMERATELQAAAAVQEFPDAEREWISECAIHLTASRSRLFQELMRLDVHRSAALAAAVERLQLSA
ncbi:MAG: hypothetical protein AAFQ31_05560 [Planctomycetota bacterium]